MKRILLIAFATLITSGSSVAQETTTATPAGAVDQALGLRTVVGCLSKIGDTYIISSGAFGPRQFRITSGDVSSLKGKLGFTVKVVGVVGKNDPAENQNGLYNAGSTTGVGYLTIDAKKISQVYLNCSEIGREWPGDHK